MNSYFSHDSNARNSDKVLSLRMRLGAEGYGIFFMILERLREEPEYMSIKDYNMLAFDFRVGADKVKAVIEDFGLFHFTEDGERFYSESFKNRMSKKDEKSEKARESALKRWQAKPTEYADVMRTHSNGNANKVKESKTKESKVKGDTPTREVIPEIEFPFDSDSFRAEWQEWKKYKAVEHRFRYRSEKSENTALKKLKDLSGGKEDVAVKIIQKSIANGWKGFFALKQEDYAKTNNGGTNGRTGLKPTGIEPRKDIDSYGKL